MAEKNESREDMVTAALRMTAAMAEQDSVVSQLRQGLDLCVRILDCDRGLLICESVDGKQEILEKSGPGDTQFSTTALRLVKEKGKPLLIPATGNHEILSSQESIARQAIRTVLCACLESAETLLPEKRVFLYLDSFTDHHPFSMSDFDKFRLLTQLMGSLVKKSELLAMQEATIEELRSQVEERQYEDLVYASDAFAKCIKLIEQAAPTNVPVLLYGETGTGKEMLARMVHRLSPRQEKPFLAVNCGAIPSNLIESQLFGHEKGAFTGAVSAHKGVFEETAGGTLFLDEIGELSLEVQAHFLRVLQENEIMRVGSTKSIKIDARIVAATNVNLEKAVAEGGFRNDLFYRLNVLPIKIPAVRERAEDALLLARFFLKQYCTHFEVQQQALSREAEKAILMYDWPGNVREIQNKMQRAVITASGRVISSKDLGLDDKNAPIHTTLRDARDAVDKEVVQYALTRSQGNLTNAAKILDVDRKTLKMLMEKHGLQ